MFAASVMCRYAFLDNFENSEWSANRRGFWTTLGRSVIGALCRCQLLPFDEAAAAIGSSSDLLVHVWVHSLASTLSPRTDVTRQKGNGPRDIESW